MTQQSKQNEQRLVDAFHKCLSAADALAEAAGEESDDTCHSLAAEYRSAKLKLALLAEEFDSGVFSHPGKLGV